MIAFVPASSCRIEVDGEPLATFSSCTIGPMVEPTDAPEGLPGAVAFGPIEFEATITTRGALRRLQRFMDSVRPRGTPREERRRCRGRRHGQRPPTRGYWVRRCACVACDLRNGQMAEMKARTQ